MDSNTGNQEINENQNPVINILISTIATAEQDIMSELVLEMLQFNVSTQDIENNENNENNEENEETQGIEENNEAATNNSHLDNIETNSQQVSEDEQQPTNVDDINMSNAIRRSISGFRQWMNDRNRGIFYNQYSILNPYETMATTTTNAANTFVENIILQSLNQKPTYKNVLSDEGKNDLKKMPYKKNAIYNTSCPILMIDFEEDQEVIVLPCNHCFLPEAIEKWLEEEKAECPVCRLKLKSKEVKNTPETTSRAAPTNQNADIPRNRQNLFRSLNNSYSSYAYLDHPYGPRAERNVVPHSYIPEIENNISLQELNDIELAILLSLTTE